MTDMHRPGRIGADEFNVDLLPLPQIRTAVIAALVQCGADHALPLGRREAQVQETGSRHFGRGDARIGAKSRSQRLGNVARLLAGGFCQHHRSVGGHVAMRGVSGWFDRHIRGVETRGQFTRLFHLRQRIDDQRADIRKEVHGFHP